VTPQRRAGAPPGEDTPTAAMYFAAPAAFGAWLARYHETATVLWVGYYKKGSGRPSLTWPESVDEALCYGWIDGVRRRVDDERYAIRFTPRKPNSRWSLVNVRRVKALTAASRMHPAGLAAFQRRRADATGTYSYEQRHAAAFDRGEERRFQADTAAWTFFQAEPAGYRRTATHWVTSAKRAETRRRRLETLIADSAAGRRIAPLRRTTAPRKSK